MKANELMIGDWVHIYTLPNEQPSKEDLFPAKITGVLLGMPDENLNTCEGIIPNSSGGYGIFSRPIDTIIPIPLTPEILEKNGFILDKEYQEWYKDECPFSIMLGCDFDGECSFVYSEFNYRTPLLLIKHVHILQHVLRLCGFNELADNFKIE